MTTNDDQPWKPDTGPDEATASTSYNQPQGQTIGDFRVVRKIGEGGMGVVYEAEQLGLNRTVALKVVRGGQFVDEYRVRLFQREAQALARLKHPSIAAIYEAGHTEDGQHFFAMELVRGVSMSERFRGGAHELSLSHDELGARLRLFRKICDAVNYAHQRGVIHRDLKPSNILVTDDASSSSSAGGADPTPAVKVLDFGLARITETDLAASTAITQAGKIQGTFAYMSPEQARANPDEIDLRTDVYSLGVILYELVTGQLPLDITQCTLLEAVRVIEEDTPRRPSRVWADGDAPVKLDADLETLILKALAKNPNRRYQNALALGEDIDRYLANEAILAVPPSLSYQLRKLVARHTVPVAFAATLLVLLVGFAVTVTVQSARIARERTAAVAAREDADRLISFMIEDLRANLAPLGRLDILDGVGDQVLEYFDSLPEGELDDEGRFLLATTLRQIGEVRFDQGYLPAALEVFERSLALSEELGTRESSRDEWREELGQTLFWVGNVHWERGNLDAAIPPFEGYLEVAEQLAAGSPENPDLQLEVAYAHNNLAFILLEQNDLAGALAKFEMVMAAVEELSGADPTNASFKFELADAHNRIGAVLDRQGNLLGAEEHYRIDLGMKQELAAADPDNVEWQEYLAISHNLLAEIQSARDDIDDALAGFRKAAQIHGELAVHDPTNNRWRRELAADHSGVARQLLDLEEPEAAAASARAGLAIMNELVAADPTNSGWQRDLARLHHELGTASLLSGGSGTALQEAASAAEISAALLATNPDDRQARLLVSQSHLLSGRAHSAMGNEGAAANAFSEAATGVESMAAESHDRRTLLLWAEALLRLGRTADAQPTVDKLIAMDYRNREFIALCRDRGISIQ